MMQQATKFSSEQDRIIKLMRMHGCFTPVDTPLMVIMCTQNFARNEKELIGIIKEYPGMDVQDEILSECLVKNKNEGFLCEDEESASGYKYYWQNEDALNKYLEKLPDVISSSIRICRETHLRTECVVNYGLLSGGRQGMEGKVQTSFLQGIGDAQKYIDMAMLNTDAHEATVKALRERAEMGVEIRILLADYEKVVSKLRSGKKSTIKDWADKCADLKNIEIRVYDKLEDSMLSSSAIFDKSVVRLDVVDTLREKTSNGTLIECYKKGYELNITKMVLDCYDDIWRRARPVNVNKLVWLFRQEALMPIALLALLLAMSVSKNPALTNLFNTVFGIVLGAYLKQKEQDIRSWWKKLQSKLQK